MEIVPREDVIDIDKGSRNTKRRYLETDAICTQCGCIINSYYENTCIMCKECGGEDLISGKVGISLRLLLDFSYNDLRGLAEIRGCRISNRLKIIVDILKMLHPEINIGSVYRINPKTNIGSVYRVNPKTNIGSVYRINPKTNIQSVYQKNPKARYININESLIWKMIKRERKRLWYVKDIDYAMSIVKLKKAITPKKHRIKIRLLSEDEVIIDGNH